MSIEKIPSYIVLSFLGFVVGIFIFRIFLIPPTHGHGFIDISGRFVIPPTYEDARSFSEGLAAVQFEIGEKVGYIDKQGEIVIPPSFSQGFEFSDGMAQITTSDRYSFGFASWI
jgi:WG containing repeat